MQTHTEALNRVRTTADRLVNDGKIVSELDQSEHTTFPISISIAEATALRDWVHRENAARTIEIGLAYGMSALFICEGLLMNGHPDKHHVVVDPFQTGGFKDCGLQVLREAGVGEFVEHHGMESQILLPRLLVEGAHFDFAFVDGSHLFDAVFMDLMYLGRLVKPGGIIFVDDYQLPAISRAVSFCLTNLKWTMEELSQPDELHQWAVLRTPKEPIKRNFRDYVDF